MPLWLLLPFVLAESARMKANTQSLPKFKRFRRRLNLKLYEADGLLDVMWQLTAKAAPDGAIGRLSNEDIADELG